VTSLAKGCQVPGSIVFGVTIKVVNRKRVARIRVMGVTTGFAAVVMKGLYGLCGFRPIFVVRLAVVFSNLSNSLTFLVILVAPCQEETWL